MDSTEVTPTDVESNQLELAMREAKGTILTRHGDVLTGNQAGELAVLVGAILLPYVKYASFTIMAEHLERAGAHEQAAAVRAALAQVQKEDVNDDQH